jgi:glycosidase/fibronectin type 3 domain-containing protein
MRKANVLNWLAIVALVLGGLPANARPLAEADRALRPTIAVEPIEPAPQSGQDNLVEMPGLGHNSQDSLYRVPFGAVTLNTPVILRFRTFANDVSGVRIRFYDTALGSEFFRDMTRVAQGISCYTPALAAYTCDYWQYTVTPTQLTNLYYRFIITDGAATAYYADDDFKDGGWGAATLSMVDNSYEITVYDPAFQPISWMQNAVVYQIFPDRFRNGDPANDPQTGDVRYDDPVLKLPWGTQPEGYCRNYVGANTTTCPWRFGPPPAWAVPPTVTVPLPETPRGRDYMGGDLKGVTEKLDYLQALGVTVIYFNPIFDAGSNHSYDTQDYLKIDPYFGTLQDWNDLIAAANARGMKVILDGVFNHLSSDSKYFDRYGHYAEVGACEAITSTYRSWFYFTDVITPGTGTCAGTAGALSANYEGWFGFDSIPVINKSVPEVRTLFYSVTQTITEPVAQYWLDHGAAGWRLDVMGDPSFPNDYWQQFRTAVKTAKPDAIIIGELWKKGELLPKVLGDMADTGMHYRFRNAILGFFGTVDDKGFNDDGQSDQPPTLFASKLNSVREDYPDATYYTLMNLLTSHDTRRILWQLTPGARTPVDKELNAANLAQGKQLLKLASLVQMTLPGAPTIYYGDEVALNGDDDPGDRRTFPWLFPMIYLPVMLRNSTGTVAMQSTGGGPINYYDAGGDHAMLDWYRQLTVLRHAQPVFSTGKQTFLLTDDVNRTVAYLMRTPTDAAVVAVNRDSVTHTLMITATGDLPDAVSLYRSGLSNLAAPLGGGGTPIVAANGVFSITLPPLSGEVLLPAPGQDLTPPAAPTSLTATPGLNLVGLTWICPTQAIKFDVYRSYVIGGGYQWITTTNTTVFTDTSAVNGTFYYYVVKATDAAGNQGANSNEAFAVPSVPVTSAILQSPKVFTHTIGITPTVPIYGRVGAIGVTDASGNQNQIVAQVGYGTGSSATWTTWTPMTFTARVGNEYDYQASVRPEITGTFDVLVRFSTNSALTWTYGDQNGIGTATPGVLYVVAGSDVTPPAAPTLSVIGSAAAFVALQWTSIGDAAEYWLYRHGPGGSFGAPQVRLTAPSTIYTDTDVTTNVTYTYAIKAVDYALNQSALSNLVDGVPAPRMVTVTFNVTVPAFTPGNRTVYIVGNHPTICNWCNPHTVALNKVNATTWTINLSFLETTQLEYKYTLGSWDNVEKDATCAEIGNRQVTVSGLGLTQTVPNTVLNWRNIAPCGN